MVLAGLGAAEIGVLFVGAGLWAASPELVPLAGSWAAWSPPAVVFLIAGIAGAAVAGAATVVAVVGAASRLLGPPPGGIRRQRFWLYQGLASRIVSAYLDFGRSRL